MRRHIGFHHLSLAAFLIAGLSPACNSDPLAGTSLPAGGVVDTGTPTGGTIGGLATGGVAVTGGVSTDGGSVATGGLIDEGGALVTGGSVATVDPAGGTSGGDSGSGGQPSAGGVPTGGSVDAAADAAEPTPSIPAGYPVPSADNYAKCQKVPVSDKACVGQPAGDVCIQCLFGGSTYGTSETTPTAEGTNLAGNYLVTLALGGAADGTTYVSAESSRGLLAPVTTRAGQFLAYAFVVNVRAMEGQPQQAGGPSGYPGLDLFFSGPAATPPQISAIGYAMATDATKPVMVYIASDSTACDQTGGVYGGWGQMLPEFFAPPVGIANYANSGASSSFGYWTEITSRWTAGDWVIIQFGTNDKAISDTAVQANLESMVADAQAAKVNAILVSPPARVTSVPVGNQSTLHAAAAQAAAAKKGVPYIDLTSLSSDWYDNVCKTATVALTYHANGSDATHTNLLGAEKLAGLVVKAIQDQNIGLAQYLRQ